MVRMTKSWFLWGGMLLATLLAESVALPYGGEKAPDLYLQNLAGEEVSLAQWEGKTVVVNFWATWCKPCREEIPDLARFFEAHREHNVVVLGVAMDKDIDKVRTFVREFKVSYPVVVGNIVDARKWKVRGLPMTFIVSPAGDIERRIHGGLTVAILEGYAGLTMEGRRPGTLSPATGCP